MHGCSLVTVNWWEVVTLLLVISYQELLIDNYRVSIFHLMYYEIV